MPEDQLIRRQKVLVDGEITQEPGTAFVDHRNKDHGGVPVTQFTPVNFSITDKEIITILQAIDSELGQGGSTDVTTVKTTNATVTTIATIPLAEDSVLYIEARVQGRRTNGSAFSAFRRAATIFRDGAGAAVRISATETPHSRRNGAGSAGYDAFIEVSGNNALIQVRGEAAHNIDWQCFRKLFDLTTVP